MTQARVWFNGQYDWTAYSFDVNPLVWTYPQNVNLGPLGSTPVSEYEWKQVSGIYAGTTSTALTQRAPALALKSDGTLWQFRHTYVYDDTEGPDRYKITGITSPEQIGSDTWLKITTNTHKDYAATGAPFITVSVINRYLMWLGIKSDGTLWGFYGVEFGDVITVTNIVQVASGTWIDVAESLTINGRFVAAAVKSDGTLWAWGDNSLLQCGQPSGSSFSTPQQIGTDTDWAHVAVNDTNGWAVKTNGTVYAWGQGQTSGVYQTTGANISTPTQLQNALSGKTVTKIAAHVIGASGITTETTGNCYSWGKPTGLGQLSSNTDRRPTALNLDHLSLPNRIYKFLDIGSTYISSSDGTFIGGASNGQIYHRVGSNTFYPVDTSWVDNIAGSDPTRTGSDWILGSSFNNREYVLINSLPPTMTVTSDLTSNKSTDGVLSLNIATTFASINVDWGDSSSDTDYPFETNTTHLASHDYKPGIITDSLFTATITASNERYSDVVVTLSNMQVFDSPYSPTFTTDKDGAYSYGGFRNILTNTTSNTIVYTNTTSAEPGPTSTFTNNEYRWNWGDATYTDLNVGAGLAGTPGNGTISKEYTFTPTATYGKKSLTVNPYLSILTDSVDSPWGSTVSNFKYWRQPELSFTLDNGNTDSIVFLQNTSLYADNYVIHWSPSHTTTITNNTGPGGGASIPISFNYQTTGGVTADGPQTIYISSPFPEVNQTFTSASSNVDVFITHSPAISSAQQYVLAPTGTGTTNNVTFNSSMSTTAGPTSTYPLHYWMWLWDDGTTSNINVQPGLAGNPGTTISRALAVSATSAVGVQTENFSVTTKLYTLHPSSPFTSNAVNITAILEPVLGFTLAGTGNTLQFTNTSLNANDYTIKLPVVTSTGNVTQSIVVGNNSAPGGNGGGALTVNYLSLGLIEDGSRPVYIETTIPQLGQTFTSATQYRDIFIPHSPSISSSVPTRVVVAPGTTTTASLQFTNNALSTVPGPTATYGDHYWRWVWDDGTTSNINVQPGLAGNSGTNISRTLNLNLTSGVGVQKQTFDVYNELHTRHPSSPFTSNTISLDYYLEPVLDFTLAASGNQLSITNTSLNANSYTIYVNNGTTTTTYTVASNAAPGGNGGGALLIPGVTKDTTYSVYITATLPGSATVYTSATKTQKVYAVIAPVVTTVGATSLPYLLPFTFSNNTVDSLGATAQYPGNKWRWEWGDGTYTDVNVHTGLAGDYNTTITKNYTLTLGQINAGVPVPFTVTLKAYNGHPSSPFSGTTTVYVLPSNPNFPNRVFTTLDDGNIPDIVSVKTTKTWGVTGGGNT